MKKTILLLGGTGFLGMNVLDYFTIHLAGNTEVFFVVIGNKDNYENPGLGCVYHKVNFSDDIALRALFSTYQFSEVFHFISTSVPSTSNNDMKSDVTNNLISTLNLLKLMVEFNVLKITYLSSGGTVYGEPLNEYFQEDNLHTPNSSYGIVKISIENYIKLYANLHGIKYLILRISNPFGPFHVSDTNGFINIAIRNSLAGRLISVWGDGNAKKDYIFAPDFAKIFWDLYTSNQANNIVNIGSGSLYSINEILSAIVSILPNSKWEYTGGKVFDTNLNYFSIDKLKEILELETTNLLEAIQKTYLYEKSKT